MHKNSRNSSGKNQAPKELAYWILKPIRPGRNLGQARVREGFAGRLGPEAALRTGHWPAPSLPPSFLLLLKLITQEFIMANPREIKGQNHRKSCPTPPEIKENDNGECHLSPVRAAEADFTV